MGIGADAEVSLQGASDKGLALEVIPHDPSVCTIHEHTPGHSDPNWRRFVITALRKGDTWIEARLPPPDLRVFAYLEVQVTGSRHGIRLVFFPGERKSGSALLGTIYVIGGEGEHFAAAGGLEVGHLAEGGHTADPTPAGLYTLGPQQHVITPSWPKSVIPWGANLRINKDKEIEFEAADGKWHLASGPKGEVTQAGRQFFARERKQVKTADLVAIVRNFFIDPKTGDLRSTTWKSNDFGRWGWNLRLRGTPTAYYIHTTPDDEAATDEGKAVLLGNSHGCVHLKPNDRDTMMKKGYLKEGVEFEVRRYTDRGPP
jgi:hypothetical protein